MNPESFGKDRQYIQRLTMVEQPQVLRQHLPILQNLASKPMVEC
jgi:hypothetical protein